MNEALKSICDSMLSSEQSGGWWSEPQRDVARIFLGLPPVTPIMKGKTIHDLLGDVNKMVEADGVEWISHQAQAWVNNCFLGVNRLACGKWTYKMTPTKNRVLLSTQSSGGTAPTIEEAKMRVVETAKRWNQ